TPAGGLRRRRPLRSGVAVGRRLRALAPRRAAIPAGEPGGAARDATLRRRQHLDPPRQRAAPVEHAAAMGGDPARAVSPVGRRPPGTADGRVADADRAPQRRAAAGARTLVLTLSG